MFPARLELRLEIRQDLFGLGLREGPGQPPPQVLQPFLAGKGGLSECKHISHPLYCVILLFIE